MKTFKECCSAGTVAFHFVLGLAPILLAILWPQSVYLSIVLAPIFMGISFIGALMVVDTADRRTP